MKNLFILFLVILTGGLFGNYAVAQQAVAPGNVNQQGNATDYTEVAKIFDLRCVSCHSGNRPADGLRLDTYKDVMAGGKNGPVIVPGKPAESKLLKHLRGDLKPRMPKNGPPWLTDAQVDLIQRWIQAGSSDVKTQ
jgi:mono/diheme cytochrome c family protein